MLLSSRKDAKTQSKNLSAPLRLREKKTLREKIIAILKTFSFFSCEDAKQKPLCASAPLREKTLREKINS